MSGKGTEGKEPKRTLILCVDRDGDLDTKAGIKTPLIGKKANLDAAVSLALSDPEEPDANAMFEAVSLFDRLQKDNKANEIFEVATICGSERGGVGADRKLVAELTFLQEAFNANEVILVTDGYSDEAVLPLVESRVPVSSVRRIVVKHSESIEESAALFVRYLKLIVENPKYSRIALGIPGILFFIWGLLSVFPGYVAYYLTAIVLVFGGFLLIKGFGVDKAVKGAYTWAKEYSPPPLPMQISNYTAIAGVLCIAVSVYSGYLSVHAGLLNSLTGTLQLPADFAGWLGKMPTIIGLFIRGSIDLIVVGIATVLFGRSIRLYFARDTRILLNGALIVSVAWSRQIFIGAADILVDSKGIDALVFYIVVGVLIAIASILVVFIFHRSAKGFFSSSNEKVDEFTESQTV